jgi:hypothetical protein
MNEPTMTASATTPDSSSTSATPAAPVNVAEVLYGNGQKATETQTAPAGEAAKGSETPATEQAPQAEAKATADAKPVVPEKYEFKAPEGREFDGETIAAYSEVARELGLSQDAAQKLLDRMGPQMAQRQEAQIQAVRNEWTKSATSDKEFGGPALAENLSVAKKALDAFGTPELRDLLNTSGLGNHPEVIRLFFRAGKAISEDRFVGGSATTAKARGPMTFDDAANALYS